MRKWIVFCICCGLLLSACGPTAAIELEAAAGFAGETQTPTRTPEPTLTDTPEPTETPTITPTPEPPSVSRLNVSRLALLDEIRVHPSGQVLAMDVSPDGCQMITGSTDNTTRLLDLERSTLEKVFYLSSVGTFATAFSPSGEYFLSGHGYGDIWRVRNLDRIETMDAILSMDPYNEQDGELLSQTLLSIGDVVVSSDMVELAASLDPESAGDLRLYANAALVGLRFGVEDMDLWRDAAGMETFPEAWRDIFSDAPLEEPVWLWHVSYTNTLPEAFDAVRVRAGASVDSAAYSSAEDVFAYGTGHLDGNVTVVNQIAEDGSWLGRSAAANPEGQYQQTISIDFSPDGASFATGGDSSLVRIWDTATGEMQQELSGHTGWIFDVDYSGDGRFLASTGYDGRVIVWDTSTWEIIQTVNHSGVLRAVLSHSGDVLFSGGNGFMLKVWDVETGEELQTIEIPAAIKALDWTPSRDILVVGAMDGMVRLYGLEFGQ